MHPAKPSMIEMMGLFAMKFKARAWLHFSHGRWQVRFYGEKGKKVKNYSDRLPHGAFLFSPNSLNKIGLVGWSVAYAT
jgi:hypothetical protein